ncbi:hypothetical protein C408_0109 [Vibrio diabolicus E0666]|nr:hypothetical protein C408_0109 [Vibrio diabolicus E0666]
MHDFYFRVGSGKQKAHDKIVRFYFPYGAAINASLPLSHSNIQI